MRKDVQNQVAYTLKFLPLLKEKQSNQIRLDYDQKADVLYLNFGVDNYSDDSELMDIDVVERKRQGKTVGFTILNASKKYSMSQD